MSPRSGREGCTPSPPPNCRGAEVRAGPVPPGLGGGHGLCLPPGSAPPAGGRLLAPYRPAVRSRCSSGGDSHELGDARCPHGQAAAARSSPAPLQRLPLLRGRQRCAVRVARVAGVVNLTQVAGGCCGAGSAGKGATRGAAHARGCQPLELPARLGAPALHSRRCHSDTGLRSAATPASRSAPSRL